MQLIILIRYNFVEATKKAGGKFVSLHTSGHAPAADIKKVCELTKPKVIVPIHCETPEAFTQLGIQGDIRLLQDGESVTI